MRQNENNERQPKTFCVNGERKACVVVFDARRVFSVCVESQCEGGETVNEGGTRPIQIGREKMIRLAVSHRICPFHTEDSFLSFFAFLVTLSR